MTFRQAMSEQILPISALVASFAFLAAVVLN